MLMWHEEPPATWRTPCRSPSTTATTTAPTRRTPAATSPPARATSAPTSPPATSRTTPADHPAGRAFAARPRPRLTRQGVHRVRSRSQRRGEQALPEPVAHRRRGACPVVADDDDVRVLEGRPRQERAGQ